MRLAQLQQNFASALRYQAEAIDCDISEDQFSSNARLQVYRNNFILSLTDVLKVTYKNILLLVGEECFDQLARHHIIECPPTSGDVNEYGDNFWVAFDNFPEVTKTAPYLKDVAKFEWLVEGLSSAQLSKAHDVIPLNQLQHITEDQQPFIQLVVHQNLHSFSSDFAIFDLIQAIDKNDFDNLEINQPQQGFAIASPTGNYSMNLLSVVATQLLKDIEQQRTLGEIEHQLLGALPELAQANVITGFRINR
ncbi:conserved domain protein [Vibrio ishigakensis]|uniref:Conserved domain protein n=1 Tax=Vibrio ishigakensis TaxID=1481914 RepID=A0A0B8NR72_9VIBR|nr:DNA-binding domain-containing protein [Vibrio ishigakensis]GAM57075.1 conserved domain protein [Vibrio ishigakensis]